MLFKFKVKMKTNKYTRWAFEEVENRLGVNPVVALLGPRQCGKTTLAKQIQKNSNALYLDLENPEDVFKLSEPLSFLRMNEKRRIIIDEIQLRPELFGVLRSFVDSVERNCEILILGSASRELIRQGAESLAGRVSFLEMTPFLKGEIVEISEELQVERGGYPLSLLAGTTDVSVLWREDYIRSLIERDLPLLGLNIPPVQIRRLMMMLGHTHGEVHNAHKLGESLGVTGKTIKSYMGYLEGTFLIRSLMPYAANLKKRLVKSPKVYYRDTGILHSILNIMDYNSLLGHPVYGNSWEGYVIEQVISTIPPRWDASFYRTQAGAEVDLVLQKGEVIVAIECKVSRSPSVSRGFWSCLEDLEVKPENSWIICPINEVFPYKNGARVGGINQICEYLKTL